MFFFYGALLSEMPPQLEKLYYEGNSGASSHHTDLTPSKAFKNDFHSNEIDDCWANEANQFPAFIWFQVNYAQELSTHVKD